MSNETKRGVFLQLGKENRDLWMDDPESIEPKELIEQDYQDWIHEYDAALPDENDEHKSCPHCHDQEGKELFCCYYLDRQDGKKVPAHFCGDCGRDLREK